MCHRDIALVYRFLTIFFFKQKTSYEMRISDWSSDVCSSDLLGPERSLSDYLKPQNSNQMPWFRSLEGHDPQSIGAGFGMTETMGPHSGFRGLADTFGALRGSVGPALSGVERRIIEDRKSTRLNSSH